MRKRPTRVNLRKSLFILPNLFTCSSIFCGFYAVVLCSDNPTPDDFYRAALLIVFAMFFDTIDGRVARLTKTQSAFGVQLDSLADVASFGVSPAILVYEWALKPVGFLGVLVCFVYLAAGAIRLARFNVLAMGESGAPKKPGKYIVGLPIPGAAGILVSLVVANDSVGGRIPGIPALVMAVVLALSFFMVSTVKFRSFKDIKLSTRTLVFVAIAIASTAAVALKWHISVALVWLLANYIAIGVVEGLFNLSRRGLEARRRRKQGLDDEDDDDDLQPDDDDEDEDDELSREEMHVRR